MQYATGFSSKPKSFAQTLQLATNQPLGATLADTTVANPSPDLLSVHCATRSLCFAAGGYFATEATRTGYVAVTAANPSATYVTGKVDAMVSPAPASAKDKDPTGLGTHLQARTALSCTVAVPWR